MTNGEQEVLCARITGALSMACMTTPLGAVLSTANMTLVSVPLTIGCNTVTSVSSETPA